MDIPGHRGTLQTPSYRRQGFLVFPYDGKAGGAGGRRALLPEREEPSLGDW
jgi:hypothetical protein